jgi:hypothetical protein
VLGTDLIISKLPDSRNALAFSSRSTRSVIPACPLPDETRAKPLEARPISTVYELQRPSPPVSTDRRGFLLPIMYAATAYRGIQKSTCCNEEKGTIISAYV